MNKQLPAWILKDNIPLKESVVYVDVKNHNADREFMKANIKVKIKSEAHHKDWKYCLVFAAYRKKDHEKFITAMKNHYNSLLITGNTDLNDFMSVIEEKFKIDDKSLTDQRLYYSDEE